MLRTCTTAGLALLIAAQPARAVSLDMGQSAAGEQRHGAFAGARLRLSLGASPKAEAALTLAPMQRATGRDGSVRMRFGEGLSLGAGRSEPVTLRLAGTRIDRLRFAPGAKLDGKDQRHGISTLGYVAIGTGVLLVGAFLAYGAIGDAATE